MRIKKLLLKNFRNYGEEVFGFDEGLNVLYGKNAQGKTNCAEAVFYLCTGASPRAKKDKQLIKSGEESAYIRAEAEGRYGSVTIEANIYENKREVRVNGVKISKNADLLGNINSVFFSPGELRLIQDGPEERRRFLNVSNSQMSRSYYTALIRYNIELIYETLPVWDAQLAHYAAELVDKRKEYLEMLAPLAQEKHAYLTDNAEKLEISAEKCYGKNAMETEQALFAELSSNYERDIRLGFTASGPHRDDIKVLIDGVEARVYGSQGQTRTAALAVKLAEVEIFRQISGEYPVLILDDVMSELDLSRRKKLIGKIDGIQTILTCTHTEKVLYGKECNKIRIANGKIISSSRK